MPMNFTFANPNFLNYLFKIEKIKSGLLQGFLKENRRNNTTNNKHSKLKQLISRIPTSIHIFNRGVTQQMEHAENILSNGQ